MKAVLPRARRKRIKPPPPSFWRALAWVVWDLVFIGWAADWADQFPWLLVLAAAQSVTLARLDWPRFRRELDAWKGDQRCRRSRTWRQRPHAATT